MKSLVTVLTLVFSTTLQTAQTSKPLTKKEQQRHDQLAIAVQKICPVSGQKLGQHGPPIKVAVGKHKQQIFLCCKGCSKGSLKPKHWATIHANYAKAQRICPVMKHKLPQKPKWTVLNGQLIYVCCPPCVGKMAKRPNDFIRKIDELYANSLQSKSSSKR